MKWDNALDWAGIISASLLLQICIWWIIWLTVAGVL